MQNGCGSYYKCIHCISIDLSMVLPSINQLKLMFYDPKEIIKSSFKDITCIYCQDRSQNNSNTNHILMLIIQIVCMIYQFYSVISMNHISIEKHILIRLIIAFIFRLIEYVIAWYYQWNEFKMMNNGIDEKIRNVKTYSILYRLLISLIFTQCGVQLSIRVIFIFNQYSH